MVRNSLEEQKPPELHCDRDRPGDRHGAFPIMDLSDLEPANSEEGRPGPRYTQAGLCAWREVQSVASP